jgi:UPF0271 protein
MLQVRRLGDTAFRIERPAGLDARCLFERARAWPAVIDAVVTERHVAVYFAAATELQDAWLAGLAAPSEASLAAPREHMIAVVYDGPDLDDVAARAGLRPREVIAAHQSALYEVAMMGFQPGFAYLTGLSARLVLPRRETPRTRVPAGSVAIGGRYAGVYPFASPGGWHLLGRAVGAPLFDSERGARLAVGDRVRFKQEAK